MHAVDILWLKALTGHGIWLENPDIKECRWLVFAESMCNIDQPCALLAPLFSCSLLMS